MARLSTCLRGLSALVLLLLNLGISRCIDDKCILVHSFRAHFLHLASALSETSGPRHSSLTNLPGSIVYNGDLSYWSRFFHIGYMCDRVIRVGSPGVDGGKFVCDEGFADSVAVFSLGSNNDFSFEDAFIAEFGAKVKIATWDCTLLNGFKTGISPLIKTFDYCLGSNNQDSKFINFRTALDKSGFDKVDVLKIDIEGHEMTVIPDMFAEGFFPKQILIETHKWEPAVLFSFFLEFVKRGYVLFAWEQNIHSSCCVETAWIRVLDECPFHNKTTTTP